MTQPKQNELLHPHQHDLKIIMSDGSMFRIRSTYRKKSYYLIVDTLTHPLWNDEIEQGQTQIDGRLTRFNRQFKH